MAVTDERNVAESDPTAAKLQIQGLIWGSPYIELSDSTAIVSDTGYVSTVRALSLPAKVILRDQVTFLQIDYKGKGWVSGKSHSYKAVLAYHGKTVRSFEGTWTGIGKVAKSEEVFTDATVPKVEVSVKPIEQQSEWESRRLWDKVARGIRSGDYDNASKEKSSIEVGRLESGVITFQV